MKKKILEIFFRTHVSVFSGRWVQVRGLGHRGSLLARLFFFNFSLSDNYVRILRLSREFQI